MPPKPRPVRKPSVTKSPASKAKEKPKDGPQSTKDMPPPPAPLPPQGILEPEMNALATCLRNASVKTAQIYGFYADTRRLGIQRHAPYPPRSLTAALGRDVEQFDSLLDSVESQLLHAIAVLQRDLTREQDKLAAAQAAEAERVRAETPAVSPATTRASLPPSTSGDVVMGAPGSPSTSVLGVNLTEEPGAIPASSSTLSQTTPPLSQSGSSTSARRSSTISLSSLRRPLFTQKLDLSGTALRLNTDESIFAAGLASPVALAPRSARPMAANDLPPDFLSMTALASGVQGDRPVDIDLTLEEAHSVVGDPVVLGSSADKPIELDLDIDMGGMDMSNIDLFGDSTAEQSAAGLFEPSNGVEVDLQALGAASGADPKPTDALDMELLGALASNAEDELFGALPQDSGATDPTPVLGADIDIPGPAPEHLLGDFGAGLPPGESAAGDAEFDLTGFDLSSAGLFGDENAGQDLVNSFMSLGPPENSNAEDKTN